MRSGLRLRGWDEELFHRFARDRRGSIALLFALMLVPALVLIGLAMDTSRALSAASTAQNALDAAALAAARVMSEHDLDGDGVREVAEAHFRANVEGEGKFRDSEYGPLAVTSNPVSGEVTISVSTRVETTLGKLARIDAFDMTRSSTAIFKQTDLEVGLMLDVTGSMSGHKIRDLKLAAGDLIRKLVPERSAGNTVRVALAPYASSVNVGPYKARVTDPDRRRRFAFAGFGRGFGGDDCVVERDGSHAYDDAAPGAAAWIGEHPDSRYPENSRYDCPANEIVPLTDDRGRLLSAVERFRAEGYTAGHVGLAWSWYLVSPDWAGVWPAGSVPEPYGKRDLVKAVVMMTDGEFNTSYRNGRINATSDEQARRICDRMKDKDVVVFTVGFELHERNAIRTLEQCATSARYHYLAENGEDLRRAFNDIAVKLTQLRIAR